MDRRAFLGLAGLTALGALTGCSTSGGAGKSAADGGVGSLKMPTYVPFAGPKPDFPGNAKGLDPGYLSFPASPVKSVKATPGDGSTITGLTYADGPIPPPMDSNAYWQEANKRLGVTFQLETGNDDGYPTKFNALVAGGDIKDLMWVAPNQGITKIAQLAEAKFADLTPYLSGDAVKAYPNLANLPEMTWLAAIMNGKIWGVPVAYSAFGQVWVGNKKSWEAVGGFGAKNLEEFFGKCQQLTDAKGGKWALESAYVNAVAQINQFFRGANTWRLENGKLTHMFETQEYASAIEFANRLFKAGVFYPDPKVTDIDSKLANGTVAAAVKSGAGWVGTPATPGYGTAWEMEALIPFGHDGGKGVHQLAAGSVGFTGISNKHDEKKVKMLLGVLDYLAAPFGSEEWLFLNFGVEGAQYTKGQGGEPKKTKTGESELYFSGSLKFIAQGPEYLYYPGLNDTTKQIYDAQQQFLEIAQPRPHNGHYSETAIDKGQAITSEFYRVVEDLVTGRQPVSALKGAIDKFRSSGGDKMRKEYEESIAKGH
ncbi:extracellular solute-binding protein [Nonomuraea sediminis]|uniref:extracellular solute-binding protein n=1 Tax=Nonomuraea sediminis TaxID=2835864 RepID=UPI001BDC5AB0|nr:extracellular solute-binding protein [Nonomuraea sediminis]